MDKKEESISSSEKNQKQDSSKESNIENKSKLENSFSNSNKSVSNQKNKEEEGISVPHPLPLQLNKVKHRLLFLSPTVRTGLERECNKNDFFREGDSYIGKGAFGEVWKVSHRKSNKIYVIKVMDKSTIKEQKLSDQINREIEIMYKLNHPHVMRLINHFEDDEKFYLIMPYASKGQLYSLLRRQVRFDQRTAAQYMREVLEAVRYIHSFSPKIIHRDIKPENLLLDDNYRVLLSDFGWSNFLDENESRKTFCGTPEYLSPEMAKKSGHNEMVDIWALGVLLFEFLAGYAPFSGSCPKELYTNIKKLKINWSVDFPPLAKNLISKILKLNPSERLSVDEILDHPWFTQNPPLRHVLTNYLTDEKDILKSHLIIATPESVEDKLNDLTDPHKKRKFGTLKIDVDEEEEEESDDEEENKNENNKNENNKNENKKEKNKNDNNINDHIINDNKYDNNNINNIIIINNIIDNDNKNIDIKENDKNKINEKKKNVKTVKKESANRIYISNIHEDYIALKKEKKELQKKYDELVEIEKKENSLTINLEKENEELKTKQENLKNSNMELIDQEIKKYKLLSEDREKILNELDEINNKNNELNLQNELLQNKINLMKKEQDELKNKIINLTKENNNYILQIEELTKQIEELKSNKPQINFDDTDKLAEHIKEINEGNIKKLSDTISPMNINIENFGKKVDDLINNKVLSFINDKMKTFDELLKEKNDKNNNNTPFFDENKKLIEELSEQKSILAKNNKDKLEELKNKNNILEERIKNLLEEKKINNELNENKIKELEKAKRKIKNLNDKIYDINAFVNLNCDNETFKKKLCTICQLEKFK